MMIIVTIIVNDEEPKEGPVPHIGMVYNIKETQNGYTFSFDDTDGNVSRCFHYNEPIEFEVYSIKGTMSNDGNIMFVSSMDVIPQNELYHE
ncbi:MAG: hypothetical protein LBH88_00510 [Candidatus Methanoplasma sp.]|jgi:hypothetical protein|nr:hypothetical protein [Candidatus Methanoplasma sp.]